MQHITGKRFLTGTILAIAAVLFLLVNISTGVLFKGVRLDLTSNKIYTLSPGSKQIVRQLEEPITIRLYFSKKIAQVNPYLVSFASRVQDLLVQYQRASKGKIIVEVIDPEPFSAAEDDALSYGLQGIPVDNTGTELYLGIVASNSLDIKKVIPFLQPARETNLEYDISQLIYNLANPNNITVGVLSSLPLQGDIQSQPWIIWQQLAQQFRLQELATDITAIPESVTTLMLVNPNNFASATLQAIDQFVMRGGHVLAFVDPHSEVFPQQGGTTDDFNVLLNSWGVSLAKDQVVADRSMGREVMAQQNGQQTTINYPFWLEFTDKNFDTNDVLTASLERLTLATPGSLTPVANATTTFTPLVASSDNAMLVETAQIPSIQQDMNGFMRDYAAVGQQVVAARVSGPIHSPYTDQKVDKANIVVIADADMLHDHFWVAIQNVMGQEFAVPNSGNGNFVLSALDNLSGSDALISIRNRGSFVRPFTKLQALELQAQDKYRASEHALQQKLTETKDKLAQLESQTQQEQATESFRQELLDTRRELRDVRHKLNHDKELLETTIKFVSIALIPLLIIIGSLFVWGVQIRNEVKTRKMV